MTAGEWARIKALFDAALAVQSEDRPNWLAEVCAGDPALLETLVELLRNYDDTLADPRLADPDPVFSPGQLVANRFRIIRLMARGGMGEVYEALDSGLHGVRVALKTLRLGLLSERQAHERFRREVWVAREIADPGICRMFDLIEHRQIGTDGTERVIPCLTMKLLDGESLTRFLEQNRPLPVVEALPLIRQIGGSLQSMHDKGIVHRDLKPSNIMLVDGESGSGLSAVIIDFGLAKPVNSKAEAWETKTEHQPGAPYFLAPEVLRGEKGSYAADVYAFGLIIDTMVSRSPAFRYESVEELYWRKLQGEPEPLSTRSENVPQAWHRTVAACLEKDPRLRPKSPKDVLAALDGLNPDFAKAELAPPLYQPSVPKVAMSRRMWVTSAAAAAALPALHVVVSGDAEAVNTSILVFPFQNLTKRPEYDHLCLGTVEELTRRMSYVPGLSVYPAPRDSGQDPAILGKARFALYGKLQELDGKARMAVRLSETENGRQVWNTTFESRATNPLALEAEIAESTIEQVTKRLSESGGWGSWARSTLAGPRSPIGQLLGRTFPLLPHQATQSSSAFDEYQKGRELWQQRTLAGALEAIACFEKAVEKDPQFALAYAALADVQQVLLNYNYGATDRLLSEALAYAEKAVKVDGSLPECHVSRAGARQNLWDWQESESSYRIALDRHPKFARGHLWYGGFLLQFARFDEALQEARLGIELDPFDYPQQSSYGLYLWHSGRLREAAQQLEEVLQHTNLIYAHNVLGQVYAGLSASSDEPGATDYFIRSLGEAAVVRAKEMENSAGTDPGYLKWSDLIFAQAHGARKDLSAAQHHATRLERGLEAKRISASAVAWAWAAAGNRTRSLELLEQGMEDREREMLYVRVSPVLQSLRSERRYRNILSSMRLS